MDELKPLLAEAQALEARGNWMGATGRRSATLNRMLGREPEEATPRAPEAGNDLEELGERHKPSKRNHDYLHHYWRHFRHLRHSARKVLEIGLQTPRSINMWEEFFPNATIFGIDIDPACAAFAGGRKKVFIGDQMDEQFLLEIVREIGGDLDIVIDDGLHTPYSMLRSFSYLYPALHSHGLYVIEDILNQPEIIGFLRMLMDCVNYVPPDFDSRTWPSLISLGSAAPWLARNTVSVALHRYIAFIERGFNPRDNRFLVTPEQYAQSMVEKREVVAAAAAALAQEGLAPSREHLVAKLGLRFAHHIDRYLQNPS